MVKKGFLGITQKDFSSFNLGYISYWCFIKSNSVAIGDLLFLYRTGKGVYQIYEVLKVPADKEELNCELRGMITATTKLLFNLKVPISINMMKLDKVLKDAGPIRKNLQNTIFALNDIEKLALINLIKLHNSEINY